MGNEVVDDVAVDVAIHADAPSRFQLVKVDVLLVSSEDHLPAAKKRRRVALVRHLILDLLLSRLVVEHANEALPIHDRKGEVQLVADNHARFVKRDEHAAECRRCSRLDGCHGRKVACVHDTHNSRGEG